MLHLTTLGKQHSAYDGDVESGTKQGEQTYVCAMCDNMSEHDLSLLNAVQHLQQLNLCLARTITCNQFRCSMCFSKVTTPSLDCNMNL